MTLLAQRQRLSALPDLVAAYNALSDEHQGILRATVRAAKLLTPGYLERLTKKIEEATGKKVVAEFQLDHSLIAGVVTQIGDRIVDGSVRGKLEQLRQSLRAT
jgi:F-type H+-transporting ATPase subunit delta